MTCPHCDQAIPVYAGGARGFVSPTPGRTRANEPHESEAASLKFTQGAGGMTVMAIESAVCAPCYLELFAQANPGAELPVMPKAIG